MKKIISSVRGVVSELFNVALDPELTRTDEKFGDFATNVALRIAKEQGKNPREIAESIASRLRETSQDDIAEVSVAEPGFINIKIQDTSLIRALERVTDVPQSYANKVVVAEYGDPNPFKMLHAGHLYTGIVGDAIANLLENAGATVHRVNFGGDVGLHVGKTVWAILKKLKGVHPEKLDAVPVEERSQWLTNAYVAGTAAYEEDETAKQEIIELNKHVYRLHSQNDHDTAFAHIYWTCRQWSYDSFDEFYDRIGVKFEKYYPESEVAELGLATVTAHMKPGMFEDSDGAVVFKGEPYGLHTRVFINSQGLPTYEAKDVGLIMTKYAEYKFDTSVVITGNEQMQYMAVVLKAIEQFEPALVAATKHFTHGLVKLQGGEKMSSRKGNVLRATDVIDAAAEANKKNSDGGNEDIIIGAVKYALLKSRLGGDIIYDPIESVSIEGNSGPYLQYAHARARSILGKSSQSAGVITDLDVDERRLASKLTEYADVVARATNELMPHHIGSYLYELAQTFNRFYENTRVIGDIRESQRLTLIARYAEVLKAGLELLGIVAPEHM